MGSGDVPIRVMTVIGTRPEAIKMAPVVLRLASDPRFVHTLCVTGQHGELLAQALSVFGLVPDIDLALMRPGQDLFDLSSRIVVGMRDVLDQTRPDVVLVHGDTSTSAFAALAAFYHKIPVGHVEAGLRTGNRYAPFPEEINRQLTGRLATWHFAPTERARANLLRESVSEDAIFVTGNTVVDALIEVRGRLVEADASLAVREKTMVLITGHRRENFGEPFLAICRAIARLAQRFPEATFVYPVHLNPNVQGPVHRILGATRNVQLIDPVGYLEFVRLMLGARVILTDSGGIQEEAPALGVPVLVMRDVTERPEAIAAGTARLVGADEERIVEETSRLLTDERSHEVMARAVNPFGDGTAAVQIADILAARVVANARS